MELVVSMAIIGTLSVYAVSSYIETGERAKTTKTMSNMQEMSNAVGRWLQELSGDFADVNLLVNTIKSSITDSTDIITYYDAGTQMFLSFGDIFPSGVPTSPYGDKEYDYTSTSGDITFVRDSQGNVSVIVTALPGLNIVDPKDGKLTIQTYY